MSKKKNPTPKQIRIEERRRRAKEKRINTVHVLNLKYVMSVDNSFWIATTDRGHYMAPNEKIASSAGFIKIEYYKRKQIEIDSMRVYGMSESLWKNSKPEDIDIMRIYLEDNIDTIISNNHTSWSTFLHNR